MQSSHIRTVGLCFLAGKASSFWSVFQENSVKRIFWPSPHCCFCQSRPMVGCVFIAILLFLSCSHALWLAVCSTWLLAYMYCGRLSVFELVSQ